MLSLLGNPIRLCDGVTRREWLRIGGLSALGVSLPSALRSGLEAKESTASQAIQFGSAKSCILIFLVGGHPQHETFDPKPDAPAELRGPFKPIHTNVPGVQFCELLPRTARMMDRLAIIRSMASGDSVHGSSAYYYYTGSNQIRGGLPLGMTDRATNPSIDWPSIGAVVGKLKPSDRSLFSSVTIPEPILNNPGYLYAGQNGGFMGRSWDPQLFTCDPTHPNFRIESFALADDVSPLRLTLRHSLLTQLERHFSVIERSGQIGSYDEIAQRAFDVLTSGPTLAAFHLHREPAKLRDLYGRNKFGQSLLLARRLVESGVRFVQVNWPRDPGSLSVSNPAWDTHFDNPGRCRDTLCPRFDLGFSTLIDDLDQRGLLGETLVVVLGDFGRTPKINARAGRDHWGNVMSIAVAGGGVATAQVIGSSDRTGGHPTSNPFNPSDMSATIFHLLGIDPSSHIEAAGRAVQITRGKIIQELLGSRPVTSARVEPGGRVGPLPDFNRGPVSNTNFELGIPLSNRFQQADFWIGRPHWNPDRPDDFSVATSVKRSVSNSTDESYQAQIGFGLFSGVGKGRIAKGHKAILAQEVYNQRPGRYSFSAVVSGEGRPEAAKEWNRHFRSRLIIFRFTDASKRIDKIAELASTTFEVPFDSTPAKVKVSRMMKDQGGGSGELHMGIGVAVIVEKTLEKTLDLQSAGLMRAFVRLENTHVAFLPRDFDFDKHDHNKDGKLSRDDQLPRYLEASFNELDADGDGFLTRKEIDPGERLR